MKVELIRLQKRETLLLRIDLFALPALILRSNRIRKKEYRK